MIKSVHAIGQLYTYSDMYEFWNVIFVENSEESAVMSYTAEYGGYRNNHKNNNNN